MEGSLKAMSQYRVQNACLPVLAATLLSADQIEILNLPELVDVSTMLKLIKELAGSVMNVTARP